MAPKTKKVEPTLTVKQYGEAVVEFAKNKNVEHEENNGSCVIVIYAEEQEDDRMHTKACFHGNVGCIIDTLEHVSIQLMKNHVEKMLQC